MVIKNYFYYTDNDRRGKKIRGKAIIKLQNIYLSGVILKKGKWAYSI